MTVRVLAVVLLLGAAFLAAPSVTLRGAEPSYASSLLIGAVEVDRLEQPAGIAVDSQGDVFLADATMARVQRRGTGGNVISQWSSFTTSRGTERLSVPAGVAVSPVPGSVYVADAQRRSVYVFTSNGEYSRSIGAAGAGSGQFLKPAGLAVDVAGNIFVADQEANRVQKFSATGGFLMAMGSRGIGQGQFRGPTGIAVDRDGNIYVADTENDRVQKFGSDGRFVKEWGGAGIETGKFVRPVGIIVDSQGTVYVADSGNGRVQKFSAAGEFQSRWIASGQWLAADSAGVVYVSDGASGRVEKFGNQGQTAGSWGRQGTGDGELRMPRGIALGFSGTVFVADTRNHRVQVFDSQGRSTRNWGRQGSGDGQLDSPMGVAVDAQGNIYVADTGNHRVQKFTSAGAFVTKWGGAGVADGQFSNPRAIGVHSGAVYVLDAGNYRVQRFDENGGFQGKWGSQADASGSFINPIGLSVDRSGNVYVAEQAFGDGAGAVVQKFDGSGTVQFRWTGAELGSINPAGIGVDQSGNIYLSDQPRLASLFPQPGHDRIVKMSAGGRVLVEIGAPGITTGKLAGPGALAVNPEGLAVYVADTLNQRVQVFGALAPPPPPPPPPGSQPAPVPPPPGPAPIDAPRPLSPMTGTSLTTLGTTLSWQNPADTTQFHIQVVPFNNDGPAVDLIIGDPAQVRASSFVVPAPTPGSGPYVMLPDLSYGWRVRTASSTTPLISGSAGWRGWSPTWSFRTAARSAAGSAPLSPHDGVVVDNDIVGLTWRPPSPDVFYMEVQLSEDPRFEMEPGKSRAAVYWNLVHGGITGPANTWFTPLLKQGTDYYWRVRPRVQGDGKPVDWSDAWRFRVQVGTPSPFIGEG